MIEGKLDQDAREVNTKFSKTFTTFFFPVGDDFRIIVAQWVDYLSTVKLWGPDDPLFPATRVTLGESHQFEASGIARTHWSSSGPIRAIFREAFQRAGIPYANPHSFRATKLCRSPEEFKAWSQNMGHEGVLTTFTSYGEVSRERQARIIRSIADPEAPRGDFPAIERALEAALAITRNSRCQI